MSETQEFSYEDRYGKSGGNRWVAYAAAFAAVGLLWTIWAGLHYANPKISNQLISFEVISEREISIRYSINRSDPNRVVICTLKANDLDKNVVGQIDQRIGAGSSIIQQSAVIPTRSAPVTANIVRCRAE